MKCRPEVMGKDILKRHVFFAFFFVFFFLNDALLFSIIQQPRVQKLQLSDCLLPKNHSLQACLRSLFEDPEMFNSPQHLKQAGFQVFDRVHRGLMVASHPALENYLIKKFQNEISQKSQLANYLRRIYGAKALREFIRLNHLRHIVVPKKWLYRLPKQFSDSAGERTYVLIVERLDICSGGKDPNDEVGIRYYNIDFEILRELCTVVYYFRGLDSMLHNMPFTYQNKIAFIDTERWERKREGYLKHVLPFMDKERQDYALEVFEELRIQDDR